MNWFVPAVPSFFLLSALLYGYRTKVLDDSFLIDKWKGLSVSYYGVLIVVFISCLIVGEYSCLGLFRGFISDILYIGGVPIIGRHLPETGHCWFLTSLFLCYIALYLSDRHYKRSKNRVGDKYKCLIFIFLAEAIDVLCFQIHFLVHIAIYISFYIYIKFRNNYAGTNILTVWLLSSIFVLIYLIATNSSLLLCKPYYGTLVGYSIAIPAILLAEKFYYIFKANKIISWICVLSMEIYLVHHYFVFDRPIYICLPVTILLSVLLHFTSSKFKQLINIS